MVRTTDSHGRRLAIAILVGVLCLLAAACLSACIHRLRAGLSLTGTALIFEAQPGAVAAVALGFPPRSGAAIVMLANLAPLPFLSTGLSELMARWPWARRKLQRARRWADRFKRWGPLIFVPLVPVIGAYTATWVGQSLGFRAERTFGAILIGMAWSVLVITYGGHWLTQFVGRF